MTLKPLGHIFSTRHFSCILYA